MIPEPTTYLFCWEDIPGNDSLRLINFLKKKYEVDWVTIAKIDDSNIIKATAEKNYLLLSLNNEKTEVNILIDDGRTDKLIAKTENGKLNIYLSLHNTKGGTWKGDFMEGTWCGYGKWISPGKWEGKGKWESGILSGHWNGKGKWHKDKGYDYEGDWKGSGEISSSKLPYKVDVFTLIFIVGIVVGGIGTLMGVLGLKEFPIIFVGLPVMIGCLYLLKLRNERKWRGTGRWIENQGVRELTIKDGNWRIAGLKGELSGTIKECK